MYGPDYSVRRARDGLELSTATSADAAFFAARTHLQVDGEEGPLEIHDPDDVWVGSVSLDECSRLDLRVPSPRRRALVERWGRRVVA